MVRIVSFVWDTHTTSNAMITIILLLVGAAASQVSAISAPATLYQQAGFEGAKKPIYGLDRIGSCRSVVQDFNDRTVSVDLIPGYCVRLFGANCDDKSWHPVIDLSSDSSERLDISPYGFTGPEGVSAIQRIDCPVQTDLPILYTGVGQTGRSMPIWGLDNIGECVGLPHFNDVTRSIYVPAGVCLQLMGGQCNDMKEPHIEVSATSKVNNDIGPAGYTGGHGLSTVKRIACTDEPAGYLYSETNQGGVPFPLKQLKKIGDCQNVVPDFNDRTKSVSVTPGYCLRLFGSGCNDYNHPVLEVDSDSPENNDIQPSGFVGPEGVSAVALIECHGLPPPEEVGVLQYVYAAPA